MRFKQFKLISERQLDELRMSPSSLQQFANSPEAEGIVAGFEAELVFTGLGEDDYDEIEPDMDMDERCRSIEEVIDFFGNDEWGYGLSPRGERNLREGLDEMYMEWFDEQMYSEFRDDAERYVREYIEENEWDEDEKIEEHLDNNVDGYDEEIIDMAKEMIGMTSQQRKNNVEEDDKWAKAYEAFSEARESANEELESWVEQSVADQGGYWDAALDEFRDNFSIDDDSHFFSDVGLRWMSDVRDQFDLDWPYMRGGDGGEGGFSVDNAERLADDLHEKLGVQTKVSSGYHSATRKPDVWIFEPDSSLDADESDNMPVEIVSPPMPLKDCLAKMAQFFEWAESNGAYANSSTGFHMGVSLPHRGGQVDYLKLALFLGDEHVLQEFGRTANHFCEAAMKKIRRSVKAGEQVASALDLMKHNLIELAAKQLKISPEGYGKYTSINPKEGKYIEFRSAGGTNYFEDISKLQNTLLRYARAMTVAADPAAERKEYYKKLYKLIAPSTGDVSMDLFSRFATGQISATELKTQWAETALQKDAPQLIGKHRWKAFKKDGTPVTGAEFSGYTEEEAKELLKKKVSPGSSSRDWEQNYKANYELRNMEENTNRWEIRDRESMDILGYVDAESRGQAADIAWDKWPEARGEGRAFVVFPAPASEKEPTKLSRRAELAKRIKAPKPNWNVVYRPTGRVVDTIINVSREEAQKLLPKVAQQHQFDSIDDLELHNQADAEKAELDQLHKELGINDTPVDVAQNFRQPQRQDVELYVHDNPERVFHTLHNATFQEITDYIEQQERNGMPPGFLRVRPIGSYTPPTQPAGQERAGNGVPIWELYDISTGNVVNTMADHNESEARRQAMSWLQSVGAEPGYEERFAVRPKMASTNESLQEGVESDRFVELARKFLPVVKKSLGIKKLPKIVFLNKPLEGTFGNYSQGQVSVVVKGRHPVDVLRTLAHELVHWKQELNNELGPNAGDTGSPQENEANAKAGVIMRDFDFAHPELLKDLKS